MGENGTFTIKNVTNADVLDSSLLIFFFFSSLLDFYYVSHFHFFCFTKSEMSLTKVVSAVWVWVLFLLCCILFGGERFFQERRLRSYITGKVLFSVPAPCIEPIYVFPKILAGKLGAALSTSISRCNPTVSLKDHSLSPSAPEWGHFVSAEVFQELSLAETPKETQATYETIAKSKFVRPEEEWRNHYTELRRFGLNPAAPSIYSSA